MGNESENLELAVAKALELFEERQARKAENQAALEAAEKAAADKAVEDFKDEIGFDEKTWKEKKGSVNLMDNAEPGSGGEDGDVEAFLYWMRTGDEVAARKALQVGTGSEGGYLAPSPIESGIVELRDGHSFVRDMDVQVFQTSQGTLDIPAESTGAQKFTRTAEEGAFASDDPALAQNQVTAHKWTTSVVISNELLEDAESNVEEWYKRVVGRSMAMTEAYYVAIGSGSNQHEGIFTGGTAALTFDSDANITVDEIPELYYKLGVGYQTDAAWLMDPITWRYLISLTGNQFQFNATAGMMSINTSGGVKAGTLMGKPVYLQDDVSEMATGNKTIAVGSPAYYGLVERRGLTVLRDPYSKASSGQVVFHCSFRQGGKVLVAAAWAYGTMA